MIRPKQEWRYCPFIEIHITSSSNTSTESPFIPTLNNTYDEKWLRSADCNCYCTMRICATFQPANFMHTIYLYNQQRMPSNVMWECSNWFSVLLWIQESWIGVSAHDGKDLLLRRIKYIQLNVTRFYLNFDIMSLLWAEIHWSATVGTVRIYELFVDIICILEHGAFDCIRAR